MALRGNQFWKPDADTVDALDRGRRKVRRTEAQARAKADVAKILANIHSQPKQEITTMAKKDKKSAKKAGKKIDGKKLAAQRKPRDSVAQFIKDQLTAGKSDVAKIVEAARKAYPKTTPTNGYVRWLAKKIGKEKQVAVVAKAKSKSVDVAS